MQQRNREQISKRGVDCAQYNRNENCPNEQGEDLRYPQSVSDNPHRYMPKTPNDTSKYGISHLFASGAGLLKQKSPPCHLLCRRSREQVSAAGYQQCDRRIRFAKQIPFLYKRSSECDKNASKSGGSTYAGFFSGDTVQTACKASSQAAFI